MGFSCNFPGCTNRSVRFEKVFMSPFIEIGNEPVHDVVRTFCGNHFGEDECPGHVASEVDSKICGRCGTHLDSLRPPCE